MRAVAPALALVLACACPNAARDTTTVGPGSGAGSGEVVAGACDAQRDKIARLYASDPRTADDNTTMVMLECARDPRIASCVDGVATARELESKCLAPLDEEGSEGDELVR